MTAATKMKKKARGWTYGDPRYGKTTKARLPKKAPKFLKTVRKPRELTFKAFLKQTLTDIFDAAFDMDICNFTLEELASEAGLASSTVRRLYRAETKEPRLHTIFKLCRAIKMDISFVKEDLAKVKS